MASHLSFGYLMPKLWAKEGLGVKLAVYLSTIKSRESTSSDLRVRHGVGKISTRATTLVQTLSRSDSTVESYGRPKCRESIRDNFETPFRESQEFVPFGCSLHCELQRILYGGKWWLPPCLGRGESCGFKCLWLVPTPKGVLNAKLTSCGWFLDADSHKLS
jgi:hypothetical protein